MTELEDPQQGHRGGARAVVPPSAPPFPPPSAGLPSWPLAGLGAASDPPPDPELEAALLLAARSRGPAADQAVAQLWSWHLPAVRRLARSVAPGADPHDADDLVSESFARVLGVLRAGGGPSTALRPYWLRTLRRVAVDAARRRSRTVLGADGPTPEPAPQPSAEHVVASREEAVAAHRAWASLTEESRVLLWHLVVEGRSPAQVAPLLGVSPNAVSSRGSRARERLREAFLTHRLGEPRTAACRAVRPLLGGFVRDGLSVRDRIRVEGHLRDCPTCRTAVAEAEATSRLLRRSVLPLALLPGVVPLGTATGGPGLVAVLGGAAAGTTTSVGTTAGTGLATTVAGAGVTAATGVGVTGLVGMSVAAAAATVVTVAALGTSAPAPTPTAQDRPRPAATSLRQPADPGSAADRADVPAGASPWSVGLVPGTAARPGTAAGGGSGSGASAPVVAAAARASAGGAGTTSTAGATGTAVASAGTAMTSGTPSTGTSRTRTTNTGGSGGAGTVGGSDGAAGGEVLASGPSRGPWSGVSPSSPPTGVSNPGTTLDVTVGPSGVRVTGGTRGIPGGRTTSAVPPAPGSSGSAGHGSPGGPGRGQSNPGQGHAGQWHSGPGDQGHGHQGQGDQGHGNQGPGNPGLGHGARPSTPPGLVGRGR